MKLTIKAKTIKEYLILSFAAFVFAAAWECFMIPNGMAAGGFMGLCTIIQYATFGVIDASISYIIGNALLIIVAVLAMGIGFGFKTIYCIAISTLFMNLLNGWEFLHCIPGNFFYVPERILIPVIAGILEAMGVGLILRYGGSTGGTDIIALMVNKYWPIQLSTTFLITDFIIISLLLFLPDKSFADACYGFEMMAIFSIIIDYVVGGNRSSYQLMVFSEKYKDIADYIIVTMDRGVTVLHAQGWYTKKEKDVLMIIIDKKELPKLMKVIKQIDSRAFMSITPTSNVYGEGFEEMKVGIEKKKKDDNIKK